MKETNNNLTNQAIRELSERYFTCEKILQSQDLPECRRVWFERQRDIAKDGLAKFGVDEIIAIRDNGREMTEVVIFDASEAKKNE